jgi:hypothetical protein
VLRWSRWSSVATAHGTDNVSAGNMPPFHHWASTVTLSNVRVHNGHRYYSWMKITSRGHRTFRRAIAAVAAAGSSHEGPSGSPHFAGVAAVTPAVQQVTHADPLDATKTNPVDRLGRQASSPVRALSTAPLATWVRWLLTLDSPAVVIHSGWRLSCPGLTDSGGEESGQVGLLVPGPACKDIEHSCFGRRMSL